MYSAFCVSIFFGIFYLILCEEQCGSPPEVKQAHVSNPSVTGYDLGSIVTYRCDYGFVSGGVLITLKCVTDSVTNQLVWTQPQVACTPRSCGDPGSVENARRVGSLFTFPNNVEYVCNEGYKLSGNPRRYCEASGGWSGRLPSCTVISCRRPEDPENGRAVYTSLTYRSQLRYECHEGHQLSFSEKRYCGSDGQWTGAEPVCQEIECEMPEVPDFGSATVVGNKPKVGSIVIYKCNTGRKLVGSGNSKCLKTGEWNFPTPLCIEPCIVPSVANGVLGKYAQQYQGRQWRNVFTEVHVGTTLNGNEEVLLKCNAYYTPEFGESPRVIVITCHGGQLSPEPECITTSCLSDPPEIENGTAVVKARHHGATIWYRCSRGFERTSSGQVQCTYGTWIGNIPTCKDTRCDKSSLNYPGLVRSEGFLLNRESFFPACLSGYEVAENSRDKKIYCSTGSWSGNLPPCTRARCRTEALAHYPGVVLRGYKTIVNDGNWYQPYCAEGFEFVNKSDSRIYCNEGVWEGNVPPCSPAPCLNNPPIPENGNIKLLNGSNHGSYVEYECLPLYNMVQTSGIICDHGQWRGSLPACKDTRCDKSSLNYPGLVRSEGILLNNESFFPACLSGYEVAENYGDKKIYCSAGSWSGNLPPCIKEPCIVPSVANGVLGKYVQKYPQRRKWNVFTEIHAGATVNENEEVLLKCNANYMPKFGQSTREIAITCLERQLSPEPECITTRCDKSFLNYPGLVRSEGTLLNRESFFPACLSGYEVSENYSDKKIYCSAGSWSGNLPPCTKVGKHFESDIPNADVVTSVPSTVLPDQLFSSFNDSLIKNLSTNHSVIISGQESSSGSNSSGEFDGGFVTLDNNLTENEVVTGATVNPLCSCTYIVDDRILLAHDGEKLVKYGDQILSGTTIRFYCNFTAYFGLRGSESLQCPTDCDWHSSMFPSCVATSEPCIVPSVANGVLGKYQWGHHQDVFTEVHAGTTLIENEKLLLKCNADYMPKFGQSRGVIVITCLGGQLSPEPECITTSCLGDPPQIENGTAVVRARNHGVTISYMCNEGFEKTSSGQIQCTYGTWIGNTPICKDSRCYLKNLDEKEGVDLTDDSPVYTGQRADIVCISGYSLRYPNVNCDNGEWKTENRFSPCQENGCQVKQILNGQILKMRYVFEENVFGDVKRKKISEKANIGSIESIGDVLFVKCKDGYKFQGKFNAEELVSITCRGGEWMPLPECFLPYCYDYPPTLLNGRIIYVTYNHGSRVEYACSGSYGMEGNSSVICYNGQWTGSLPTCKDNRCFLTNLHEKEGIRLRFSSSVVSSGRRASIVCSTGYSLEYPNVYCDNGEWKTENLLSPCQNNVECPKIDSTEGLFISYSPNRTCGGRAIFNCTEPYERNGPSFIICMASGNWSEPPAFCDLRTCSIRSLSVILPEGVVPLIDEEMHKNVPLGHKLELSCNEKGNVFRGDNTATCSEKRKWKIGDELQCVKGCAGLSKKNDSELQISPDKDFYDMGESITFSCPEGKHLSGDVQRILCLQNRWTPNIIPGCQ